MAQKNSIPSRIVYFLKAPLLVLFLLIVVYFAFAIFFSFLPTHPPEKNCTEKYSIFVNTNGIHVDLIVPVKYLPPNFRNQLTVLPSTQFVAFGWGDKNFYLKTPEWSDLTFGVAFKALFLKSSTAMHVTYYSGKYKLWKEVQVCHSQLTELVDFIENTFKKDEKGMLIQMKFKGYDNYDTFFEAKGSFSLFRTCNVWVNRAFKEAELKTAVWTPFDFGVLYHIKED